LIDATEKKGLSLENMIAGRDGISGVSCLVISKTINC